MYQFKEPINSGAAFWFDKKLIEKMNWAKLPKSSKAVFPVIAAHCGKDGKAFPCERTIAILSGLTDKTVRAGIRGLDGFPGFKMKPYITKRGRRSKVFYLERPPRDERGRAFPFRRCVWEGGSWQELKPASKAVYPVMRYFGFFDQITYEEAEYEKLGDELAEPKKFEWTYNSRDWDYCQAEPRIMAEYAGISYRAMKGALQDLQKCFLIEPAGEVFEVFTWRVFLLPQEYYNRGDLNKKIRGRFGDEE